MEVAREKPVATTLFDTLVSRPAPEPAGGPSFRDCFESRVPEPVTLPRKTDASPAAVSESLSTRANSAAARQFFSAC